MLGAVVVCVVTTSACDVDPDWSVPHDTSPDYLVEVRRDAEEVAEELRRDAEELAALFDNEPFGEDDGLASAGVPAP